MYEEGESIPQKYTDGYANRIGSYDNVRIHLYKWPYHPNITGTICRFSRPGLALK